MHKFKNEKDRCPECGCQGDHFCTGKPVPENEKTGYYEIDAQIKDKGLEVWRERIKGVEDDFR